MGVKPVARHRMKLNHSKEEQFKNPIIHREIQEDKVHVPLNLERLWNEV
jgi:hypothetical protein